GIRPCFALTPPVAPVDRLVVDVVGNVDLDIWYPLFGCSLYMIGIGDGFFLWRFPFFFGRFCSVRFGRYFGYVLRWCDKFRQWHEVFAFIYHFPRMVNDGITVWRFSVLAVEYDLHAEFRRKHLRHCRPIAGWCGRPMSGKWGGNMDDRRIVLATVLGKDCPELCQPINVFVKSADFGVHLFQRDRALSFAVTADLIYPIGQFKGIPPCFKEHHKLGACGETIAQCFFDFLVDLLFFVHADDTVQYLVGTDFLEAVVYFLAVPVYPCRNDMDMVVCSVLMEYQEVRLCAVAHTVQPLFGNGCKFLLTMGTSFAGNDGVELWVFRPFTGCGLGFQIIDVILWTEILQGL